MMARFRKPLILLAKLAVTVGLLGWVVSRAHWHDYAVAPDGREVRVLDHQPGRLLVATADGPKWRPAGPFQPLQGRVVRPGLAAALTHLRPGPFALAAVVLLAQVTLMGVRWWYLMRFQRVGVGLWATVRLMFIGQFFNFFLPGSTGGDVIRAYLVTRRTGRRAVAVATVLLDRFVGLAGMALLAGVMTLVTWGRPETRRAAEAVGITVLVIAAAGLVLFSRRTARLLRLDRLLARLPRREAFRAALGTFQDLPRSPGPAAVAGAMTIGVHLLLAAGIALMGLALGLPRGLVPVGHYFLFVPVIYIVAAIPVSIGGLGVIEGMYLVFFAQSSGADSSQVLAMALLARFTPMALSLPGLAFWLAERGARRAAPEPEARAPGGAP